MYEEYWGLKGTPFRNDIDARWFYESVEHEEALARLLFLVEQRRRLGLFCGPAGTGKSLLLKMLEQQSSRSQRQAALINSAGAGYGELLEELAAALRLPPIVTSSPFEQWRALRDHIAASQLAGVQTVLLFDQFERAGAECCRVLEHLWHMSGGFRGGLTLVVASRTDAACIAELADLAELRIDLHALDRAETAAYVRDLLRQAGVDRDVFAREAHESLFSSSQGIPRAINRLCDLSLLAAMGEGLRTVDQTTVAHAARELLQAASATRRPAHQSA